MQLRGEVCHRRSHSPFKPGITDHIIAILQRSLRWLGCAGLTKEAATPEQPGNNQVASELPPEAVFIVAWFAMPDGGYAQTKGKQDDEGDLRPVHDYSPVATARQTAATISARRISAAEKTR